MAKIGALSGPIGVRRRAEESEILKRTVLQNVERWKVYWSNGTAILKCAFQWQSGWEEKQKH
jgi:hypothetical protein